MRQVVLDTETTGLDPAKGHRIIEIGAVELVDRQLTGRQLHHYFQPQREIEPQAIEIHGITNEFLRDKPLFTDRVDDVLDFLLDAQLIIHNAAFDIGFLNHELQLAANPCGDLAAVCDVVDTLTMARDKHPGQKNNLDALCKRYGIDNSARQLHGALLDAQILADVFLAMTGGQISLSLPETQTFSTQSPVTTQEGSQRLSQPMATPIIAASDAELAAHEAKLAAIDKKSAGGCIWG